MLTNNGAIRRYYSERFHLNGDTWSQDFIRDRWFRVTANKETSATFRRAQYKPLTHPQILMKSRNVYRITECFQKMVLMNSSVDHFSFPFCNRNRLRYKEIRLGDLFTLATEQHFFQMMLMCTSGQYCVCRAQFRVLFTVINGCHSNALAYFSL